MNALKKVAALLVVAVMLLQIPAFAQAPVNDVIGKPCETAVRLVSALGIMQGDGTGNFNPDADITRAEFAQILMKTLKLDDAVEGYTPVGMFTDVPASNVFAKAIELGVSMGAIKGMGDGTFDPDGKVTGEQAVKLLVYAVGYEMQAESSGGYPAGYVMVASSKGILKGIDKVSLGSAIKRSDAVIMVYNALHVDIAKKVSFGGKVQYETVDGVNLMTDKFDVYKLDGIIKANSTTSFWASSDLKKGQVQIDTTKSPIESYVLEAGDTDIETQLGKYVRVYYLYNNDEYSNPTVLSYEVRASNNNVLEIDLSNVEIGESSATELKYWENKDTDTKTKKADLTTPLSIIYNGSYSASSDSLLTLIADKDGTIVLIDNDTDGNYDIAYVTAYEDYVVNGINTDDYIVYDKTSTSKTLTMDIENEDVTVSIVDKDGAEVAFDSLKEYDILSVAKSSSITSGVNRQVIKAIVSTETIEGTISEIGKKDGKTTVIIDDVEYKFAGNYAAEEIAKLEVDDQVVLYLDAFGKVAYVKRGLNESMVFGFALEQKVQTNLTDAILLKVLTQDTAFEWLTLADKVTIDGVLYKDLASMKIALASDAAGANPMVNFVMRYSLNADGKISEIDTEKKNGTESDYTMRNVPIATTPTVLQYRSASKIFEFKYPLNDTAVVFVLPIKAADYEDVKNFKVGKVALIGNDTEWTTSNLKLLNLDPESIFADAVVIKQEPLKQFATETATYDLPMMILDRITSYVDPDTGETFEKLYVMSEGAKKELIVSDQLIWSNNTAVTGVTFKDKGLKRGDAFRCFTNASGKVANAEIMFQYNVTATSPGTYTSPTGQSDDYLKIINGYVADREKDIFKVVAASTGPVLFTPSEATWLGDYFAIKVTSSFKITVFDPTKQEDQQLYAGTINDIKDYKYNPTSYSRIIVRYRSRGEKDILVYNDMSLKPTI